MTCTKIIIRRNDQTEKIEVKCGILRLMFNLLNNVRAKKVQKHPSITPDLLTHKVTGVQKKYGSRRREGEWEWQAVGFVTQYPNHMGSNP